MEHLNNFSCTSFMYTCGQGIKHWKAIEYFYRAARRQWGDFRWIVPKPIYHLRRACLFPHELQHWTLQKKTNKGSGFSFAIILQFHLYCCIVITKNTLACQQHHPSCWSQSAASPSFSSPNHFRNVAISYPGWKNIPPPHCTCGSADTITFVAELQMPLQL